MNVALDAGWERLQGSRPSLSPERSISRYGHAGRDRVIVRNELSGTHVRVGPALWRLVERFDGRTTLAEHLAAETAGRPGAGDSGSGRAAFGEADRSTILRGLVALERAGLVDCGLAGRAERRDEQAQAQTRRRRQGRWSNPLALRLPLHDPDRWLERLQPWIDAVSARAAWPMLAVLLLAAGCTAFVQADRLILDVQALAGAPRRWWALLLVWPLMKGAHELAHACLVRRFGGRVHEVGVAFLVLMPMPYVDASDAWAFPRRRERMLVSGAGMLAELLLAALALLFWSVLEAGALRDLSLAIVVAGAVSTLLFNANPLLRFDGYYLLQDLIDVPNLSTRAAGWWIDLARRRLFGLAPRTPHASRRECGWLAGYGVAAWLYRYVVMVAIAWWLLDALPLIGVPLALYAAWPLVVRPVLRLARWLSGAAELAGRRSSATFRASVVFGSCLIVVTAVPFSSSSRVTGVITDADETRITAPERAELLALPGVRRVDTGDVIARFSAPALADEAARLQAKIGGLDGAIGAAFGRDALEVRLLRGERDGLRERERALASRIDALVVRAPRPGLFVPRSPDVLAGQHLGRGSVLGRLITDRRLAVRAVLHEHQFGQLRRGVGTADVRLAEAPSVVHTALAIRESPAAGHALPSVVLAGEGAGGIAIAAHGQMMETLHPVFEVEIELPAHVRVAGLGGRAYVTFHHPSESLARRWWRATRRLFLERLAI